MADTTSAEWSAAPKIYVENVRNGDAAYHISEEAVLKSLISVSSPAALTCRFSDERDIEAFKAADILIASRLDTAFIASEGRTLKLIQCTSAGVEKYAPFTWLAQSTMLTNASGVHTKKVSEFGLMATLMLHNRVPAIATRQRNHEWSRQLRGTAAGLRVMIYGVGALGGAIARSLHRAGFFVTGVRRAGKSIEGGKLMITPDRVLQELPNVDVLILACPLTPETQRVIGLRELSALPRGAGVVNVGRGGIMDHSAHVSCLASGHLSGAILDVFDEEPLPDDSPLWDAPNLMVFPHVSADAPDDYIERCLAILAENLKRARAGESLRNKVDPTLGY